MIQLILQINQTTKLVFEPRETKDSLWVILIFLICAALIAFARLVQRNVFTLLTKSVFLGKTKEELSKDGETLSSVSGILLALQFYVIFSYFIGTTFTTLSKPQNWIILGIVPGYFIYLTIVNWISGKLLGTETLFREIQYFTIALFQGIGILYLCVVFIDYFEHFIYFITPQVMLIPVIGIFGARFLRGTVLAWQDKVPWYYIILYFWSLEILPVLVAAKLLFPEWFQEWIA